MLLFLSKSPVIPLSLPVPTTLLAETKFVRSFVIEIIRSGSDRTNFWLSKFLLTPRGGARVGRPARPRYAAGPAAGHAAGRPAWQNLSNKGKQNKPFFQKVFRTRPRSCRFCCPKKHLLICKTRTRLCTFDVVVFGL